MNGMPGPGKGMPAIPMRISSVATSGGMVSIGGSSECGFIGSLWLSVSSTMFRSPVFVPGRFDCGTFGHFVGSIRRISTFEVGPESDQPFRA